MFERQAILKEGEETYMKEWGAKDPGQNLTRILLELKEEGKITDIKGKRGVYELT